MGSRLMSTASPWRFQTLAPLPRKLDEYLRTDQSNNGVKVSIVEGRSLKQRKIERVFLGYVIDSFYIHSFI